MNLAILSQLGAGGIIAIAAAIMAAVYAYTKAVIWVTGVNSDRSDFKIFMADVRDKLETIAFALGELGAKRAFVGGSQSPLALNDFGRELSQAFGARAWAETHADDVREKVAGKPAYDIQQFCFGYVTENILNEDDLKRAKEITYNQGTILSNVLRVLAYELRDCLLEGEGVQHGGFSDSFEKSAANTAM